MKLSVYYWNLREARSESKASDFISSRLSNKEQKVILDRRGFGYG